MAKQKRETKMRVDCKILYPNSDGMKVSFVVYARNVSHAISKVDAICSKDYPGEAVSFSTWRYAEPKGGYTM
jgi:hypothetical protein